MSFLIPLFQPGTFVANADLSLDQHKFVRASGAGTPGTLVVLVSAATQVSAGILQNTPDAAGKAAKVMVAGISKAVANGVIAIADPVGPDAAGLADTKVLGVDTTNFVVGQALEAAAATPEKIALQFSCLNPTRAA